MGKKTLFFILVCSITLNLSFAGVYVFSMLNRPKIASSAKCPFTSAYAHLYTTLGLSQTQLKHIEPLARDFHAKVKIIRRQIVGQRDRLLNEIALEKSDNTMLDAILMDISLRQREIQKLVIDHILDMKQIMSPEQRNLFFKSMRQRFKIQRIHEPLE